MSALFSFALACSFSTPLVSAVIAAASNVAVAGTLYFNSVKMLDMGPSSLWQYYFKTSRMFVMLWPELMSMTGSSVR